MADDTSPANAVDKAEKLAAARKRFEELKRKKQPSKKHSGGNPQKETVPNDSSSIDDAGHHEKLTRTGTEDNSICQLEIKGEDSLLSGPEDANSENPIHKGTHTPDIDSQILGLESRGFNNEVLLETLPEIYRKQASVIEELRSERQEFLDSIRILQGKVSEGNKAMVERDKALEDLASVSEEIHTMKENIGVEQASYKQGAGEVDALRLEVASLNREIAHLQSQLTQKDKAIMGMRRDSSLISPERVDEKLRMKEEQLENMSVELSESKAALEASVSAIEKLTLEKGNLEINIRSMTKELETARSTTENLGHRLAHATESLASDSEKSSIWESKTQAHEETIVVLRQELARAEAKTHHLERLNVELQATERATEARWKDMEKKFTSTQRENSRMQLRLAELKSSLHQSLSEHVPVINESRRKFQISGMTTEDGLNKTDTSKTWAQVFGDVSEMGDYSKESKSLTFTEDTQNFLDIDLQATTHQSPHLQKNTGQKRDERGFLTQHARQELERWKGYRIDLTDIYQAYDETYSRIFEI